MEGTIGDIVYKMEGVKRAAILLLAVVSVVGGAFWIGEYSSLNFDASIQICVLLALVIPAVVLAIADSYWLLPYVLAVWAFGREVRRLSDWMLGAYHPVTVISLAPLLATSAIFLSLRIDWHQWGQTKLRKGIGWTVVIFSYAAVLGIARNHFAGIYSTLNFVVPLFILLYLVSKPLTSDQRDGIIRAFVNIAVVVAAYGWIQFLVAPPWDALWMKGANMLSIGQPLPLKIRVFSTLNSPGPAATWLSAALAAMLVNRRWRGIFGFVGTLLVGTALAITLVRSSWVSLIAEVLVYIYFSKGEYRWRKIIIISLFGVAMYLMIPLLPGAHTISNRVQTFGHLQSDSSFKARMQLIKVGVPSILHHPLGSGFGSVGHSSILNGGNSVAGLGSVDNGYLAAFSVFGWFGGIVFFYVFRIWMSATSEVQVLKLELTWLTKAFIIATLVELLFGGDLSGLSGVLFWTFVGLGLAFQA